MDKGWIKLHRKILDSPLWKACNTTQKVVMVTVLLMANHKTSRWIFDGVEHEVKEGEFITSQKTLMEITGLNRQQIRTSLAKLEKLDFLTIKTTKQTTKGLTNIKINKWELYQGFDGIEKESVTKQTTKQTTKGLTNIQPTYNQHVTTNKNVRIKEYNINNKKRAPAHTHIPAPAYIEEKKSDSIDYDDDFDFGFEGVKVKPSPQSQVRKMDKIEYITAENATGAPVLYEGRYYPERDFMKPTEYRKYQALKRGEKNE